MGLNVSKGNMYEFTTHTWNTIKGECPHDCGYCYMKRWGKLNPIRFDEKELKADLGSGNFIFVGSSCDMWAENVPKEWIYKTLDHCEMFDNTYFFQSKNPKRFGKIFDMSNMKVKWCTTVESNRWYKQMGDSPLPSDRIKWIPFNSYITIEPIMDFDLKDFVALLKVVKPKQVNIGADSGRNGLPEPPKEKVLELIDELKKFTTVHNKANLKRILNA
jgi:hypothetical protein